MASLFSYLMMMFVVMFWGLRIAVAVTATLGIDFLITPLNSNIEIGMLFITLILIVLIIRRSFIGGLAYLITYGLYFGVDLYNKLNGSTIMQEDYMSIFVSGVAILIALLTFIDIAMSKNKKSSGGNKKTDWFYGSDNYVRQKDERDDDNQYKI